MTIHSTFWYLLGPVLRAFQLSYLTSNYNLRGGDDALMVERGGKETLSAKCPVTRPGKGKAGTRPHGSRPILRTTGRLPYCVQTLR